MSHLTTQEKVYLIECLFSRGKIYSNAYRGFRTEHKVTNENTLKRIINNFMQYGTIQDRRHDYATNPTTVPDLIAAIKRIVNNIKNDILEKVFTSFRKRIEFCTDSDGAHFENIYH